MDVPTVKCLVELGFSPTEARVYCTMVSEDKMNGYQIAKILGTSRSSVYAALENLLDKGAIVSIPGETSEYAVVEPSELIDKILSKYKKNAESAKSMLEALSVKRNSVNLFQNIHGHQNLVDSVKAMINSAEKEILISTSMVLDPLVDVLRSASNRGVRIILFSWLKLDLHKIDIEFYSNNLELEPAPEQRFEIVVDNKSCLVGSNNGTEFVTYKKLVEDFYSIEMPAEDGDFLGMKTDNRLMVNIIQEHIHFDIYLNKLRKKHGGEIITPDISINSLMETGN